METATLPDDFDISTIKKSCCFTGHRRLPPEKLQDIQEKLQAKILEMYSRGFTDYWAGGALGFDMLAGITVLNLSVLKPDIKLNLALPCENHSVKWETTPREIVARLIARANRVYYASEKYKSDCMMIRNRYMVDNSSMCICYLDNSMIRGGTASTVCYAEKKGLEIINIRE